MTLVLQAPEKLPQLHSQVLIYGAGNTGRTISAELDKLGIEVLAFIDRNKNERIDYCGFRLLALDEIDPSLLSKQVIISIHNRGVNLVEIIQTLKDFGFTNLVTMVDYANANPLDTTFRYFLSTCDYILAQEDKIQKFRSLLSDDKSKNLYQQLLHFRLGHGYAHCPLPEMVNQYVPLDIRNWQNPMRLIDCGAFDGDSIDAFKDAGYEISSTVAFEPDVNNYSKLIAHCRKDKVICLPCGVGKTAGVQFFDALSGENSRVSASGENLIQICSIDETLGQWFPTMIKMDIEGAELEAIKGARITISNSRPGLAISAHHTPDDLWLLGLEINDIVEDYDFFLRCHAYSSFDTVLYALPR